VRPKVDQVPVVGQMFTDENRSGLREDYLPAVGGGFEPGRAVYGWAEVVAVALLAHSGVKRHANPQHGVLWPCLGLESCLRCGGRIQRIPR